MPLLFVTVTGLLLLAGKRFCVGDVGDLTGSAVLGRAERFSGWAASSYKSLMYIIIRKRQMNTSFCKQQLLYTSKTIPHSPAIITKEANYLPPLRFNERKPH